MNTKINEILQEIESVIVGKNEIVEKILMAILAQGHVLMEDVPGVGKTTTAMAFAKVLGLDTRRVQFTSDTVPSDIIGFSVYDKKEDEFVYKPGAIMTNLLLADEINRTSSKTQSALLEAMEEHKVTVDGKTYALPDPFIVLATQNPVGSAGTTMLPNSQLDRFLIRVSMGYAYTGFWNSEIKDASFVCLSLTDEVPASKLEAKAETWRYVQKGGFYWAGAYVCSDYILVGTDDGESGYTSATANLLLLDPKSGALLDSMGGFTGDIRCSICYDTATKAFYFDSKGGYFYRVRVQKGTDGAWKLTDRAELSIGGMSTSTPVIANGRAYIGVSGKGQFTEYSGHSITVIDLSGLSIAYTAQTQGYPQTSGLLTTGYDNYNYVYFLDNYTPGKLRVLRDKAGQKEVNYTTIERVGEGKNEQTYTTAYALFTPAESQAQYCICSPIVDENGTLYFKNDSGYLMAYGSMVESLSMDAAPTKTEYEAGEKFDPAGLKVTATYANGITRDVTKLMKAADKALTQADTSVTLIYGLGQTMYHNVENTDKTMKPGEETASKSISIDIIVGDSMLTGTIGDLNWSFSAKTSKLTVSGSFPSGASLIAAVYAADGKMIGTKILTAEGETELSNGAKIKLFLLNINGIARAYLRRTQSPAFVT